MLPYNLQFPPSIMDIEASGFGADSYPIEIGYIDSLQDRFCSLITPLVHWRHWSRSAEQTHNIPRSLLFECGSPALELALALNQRLAGKTLYSDGWVVDLPWLRKLFFDVRIRPAFRLSPIEMILSEEQITLWDQTKARVIETHQLCRHRASSDAFIIQQTWKLTWQACAKSHQISA